MIRFPRSAAPAALKSDPSTDWATVCCQRKADAGGTPLAHAWRVVDAARLAGGVA